METLRVLPNPFTFVDGDGEPMGACPADPEHAAGARMWIGATLDLARTRVHDTKPNGQKMRRDKGDARPFPQTTKYIFASEPVTIPLTAHYLDRVRCGDLIAADETSFRKAFGSAKGYIAPDAALELERTKAIADYVAAYGEKPAFASANEAKLVAPVGKEPPPEPDAVPTTTTIAGAAKTPAGGKS